MIIYIYIVPVILSTIVLLKSGYWIDAHDRGDTAG